MTDKLIFGIYPVLEALRSGVILDSIFIKKNLEGNNISEIVSLAKKYEIPINNVPIEKLNRLTGKRHQGIIATYSQVIYSPIEEIITGAFESGLSPLILVLDGITDVRNFGAISRSAECAGITAIVFQFKNSAPVNSVAIKASAGALLNIPLCRVPNLKNTVAYLKDSGLQIVGASEKNSLPYYKLNYNIPTAIVMGSEDMGINPEILKLCNENITIPMSGKIQSLNVSVATGIILFEAFKNRTL